MMEPQFRPTSATPPPHFFLSFLTVPTLRSSGIPAHLPYPTFSSRGGLYHSLSHVNILPFVIATTNAVSLLDYARVRESIPSFLLPFSHLRFYSIQVVVKR